MVPQEYHHLLDVFEEGVKTDPVKTQAIWDWTATKKIKEI